MDGARHRVTRGPGFDWVNRTLQIAWVGGHCSLPRLPSSTPSPSPLVVRLYVVFPSVPRVEQDVYCQLHDVEEKMQTPVKTRPEKSACPGLPTLEDPVLQAQDRGEAGAGLPVCGPESDAPLSWPFVTRPSLEELTEPSPVPTGPCAPFQTLESAGPRLHHRFPRGRPHPTAGTPPGASVHGAAHRLCRRGWARGWRAGPPSLPGLRQSPRNQDSEFGSKRLHPQEGMLAMARTEDIFNFTVC